MYDDYDLDYVHTNDAQDLDEYTHDLDEDYARDGQDYESLAYRHYVWYSTIHIIHTHLDIMIAQKRLLTVTLDIMCYDDLDIENINWKEILELEGDEDLHCSIKEYDRF